MIEHLSGELRNYVTLLSKFGSKNHVT